MKAILALSTLAALAMAQPENRFCPYKCVGGKYLFANSLLLFDF